jgi:hypothetical protein
MNERHQYPSLHATANHTILQLAAQNSCTYWTATKRLRLQAAVNPTWEKKTSITVRKQSHVQHKKITEA